jgi:glutathione synthase/RimK-type ligase-like ATP-grasp enzyme
MTPAVSQFARTDPRPDFLFLSSAPAGGESHMAVESGFGRPRFMVYGTASYLSFMPELRRRGRDLWLDNRPGAFRLSLPRVPLVNYMADPDLYAGALAKAELIAEQSGLPMLNHPAAVLNSRRDRSAEMLAAIPGVRTPRTVRLSAPSRPELIAAILEAGLGFPLLLRPAGRHGGKGMARFDSRDQLEAAHLALGVDEAVYVSEFVDFADQDGLYRKLRLIVVGEQVFWRHLVIGDRWLLHSGDRTANTEAEERASLAAFRTLALPRLAPALRAIRRAVGLDHFGLDVSLRPNGELLVFEANACMNALDNSTIAPPNMWEAPVAAVRAALAELHARPERWLHPGTWSAPKLTMAG